MVSVGNVEVLVEGEEEAGEVVTLVVDAGEEDRDSDGEGEGGGGGDVEGEGEGGGDGEGEEEGGEEEEGAESVVGPSVKVVVEAVDCAVVVGSITDELELELSCTPAHRQANVTDKKSIEYHWLLH